MPLYLYYTDSRRICQGWLFPIFLERCLEMADRTISWAIEIPATKTCACYFRGDRMIERSPLGSPLVTTGSPVALASP
ncbi:MAG: hypothetical protein GDA38_01610 [Hormoscilla sp. SP12CHS1]|nr:hypothetical protein [Hormoscilla sp. SP12CHS1]